MTSRVEEVVEEVVSEHALPYVCEVRPRRRRENLSQLSRRSVAGSAAELLQES